MRERTNAHTIEDVHATEQGDERIDGRVALGVDVDTRVRELLEQIEEKWHRFTSAYSHPGNLVPRHRTDAPVRGARAFEVVVVERDQVSVGGEAHIGLEIRIAERHRVSKRREGVLGGLARTSTVGEGDEAAVAVGFEIRVHVLSIVRSH
jgi:hypothetical protein